MRVHVLFFGMLKGIIGCSEEWVTLPEGAHLGEVLDLYESRVPRLKEMLGSIAISINEEYAAPQSRLEEGDEVALLPPVSGGSQAAISIVRERIDSLSFVEKIKHGEDGAVVVFEGAVRDNTRGRRTLYLDYEAYEGMAFKQMQTLAEKALADFKIRDVAIVHRLGRLEIGETSVLIVVASAHRAAAFEACRWLIDTLKRTVPIWKKEYFEDGAVWADGELFPTEILRPEGISATQPASNRKSQR